METPPSSSFFSVYLRSPPKFLLNSGEIPNRLQAPYQHRQAPYQGTFHGILVSVFSQAGVCREQEAVFSSELSFVGERGLVGDHFSARSGDSSLKLKLLIGYRWPGPLALAFNM